MPRAEIEVPWDVQLPQSCANCGATATRTKKLRRKLPSAQRAAMKDLLSQDLYGAIQSDRAKKNFLQYEVPHCEKCYRRDRRLQWTFILALPLGLLCACGFAILANQPDPVEGTAEEMLSVIAILVLVVSAFGFIIGSMPLALAWRARQAVLIKRISERIGGVLLTFRNSEYAQRFYRENLERIVPYALNHGQEIRVPLEEAIAAVSRRLPTRAVGSEARIEDCLERGQLYLRAGMYDEALNDLEEVLGTITYAHPRFLDAQFFRGQAHKHLGHVAEARADLESYTRASDHRAKVRQAKRWLKELGRQR